MTLKEINKQVAKRDYLTEEERNNLKLAIISNTRARNIAIRGAIINGNYSLAFMLSQMNCS